MIASMHIADVGARRAPLALRHAPDPGHTPGLLYADLLLAAQLGPGLLPRPRPGRIGLFAVWDDERALDRFLDGHPLARALAGGSGVRLEPLRVAGRWTGLPALLPDDPITAPDRPPDARTPSAPDGPPATAFDGPVAALTHGRLKLTRTVAFLRASATAEADALAHPGLLWATGLTRPPRLVSTFSFWSHPAAMRDFTHAREGHVAALRATAHRDFHHESVFLRFRPYAATGDWQRLAL